MPKKTESKSGADNIAFYRKYRPESFDKVRGQDHIVSVLQNSIKEDTTVHAYLFAGSRGTGKTSVARIVARELGTSENDLYEIDAASNRGIDDIRALKESVQTLPFDSKYKVYIVDEVHMMTKDAFNALLKTLEEPPKHVIFILATTELGKIPDTIISRCQVFNFKKPTHQILKDLVIDVAEAEGHKLDNPTADLIALLGEGSFRDTTGILQKVLNFSNGKKITRDEVEAITGAPSTALVNDFLLAVGNNDLEKGLSVVHKTASQNIDMKVFLKLVLKKIRIALLLKFAEATAKEFMEDFIEDDKKFLAVLSKEHGVNISSATLLALLDAYQQIDYAFIPELPLELALIKITNNERPTTHDAKN